MGWTPPKDGTILHSEYSLAKYKMPVFIRETIEDVKTGIIVEIPFNFDSIIEGLLNT